VASSRHKWVAGMPGSGGAGSSRAEISVGRDANSISPAPLWADSRAKGRQVGSMATFVGVSLPEPPGPDIVSAPEDTTPWSVMGVCRSSLAAPGVSPQAAAWSAVLCLMRRALEAATLAMAARMA